MFGGFAAVGRLAVGWFVEDVAENFVLTAETGAYAITGGEVAEFDSVRLAGSYALTGGAAGFHLTLAAAAGSYAITGVAASFRFNFPVEYEEYDLTGYDVAGGSIVLIASAGNYSLSGIIVTHPITMDADGGSYAISGMDNEMHRNVFGGFAGSGNSDGEYVSTTRYTRMVEDPSKTLSYAVKAEIRSI